MRQDATEFGKQTNLPFIYTPHLNLESNYIANLHSRLTNPSPFSLFLCENHYICLTMLTAYH